MNKKQVKKKKIKLNKEIKSAVKNYAKEYNFSINDHIFASKKGGYIGTVQAYRILKSAANSVNIENFGTHSLRKSWEYWTYKASSYNIALIMGF